MFSKCHKETVIQEKQAKIAASSFESVVNGSSSKAKEPIVVGDLEAQPKASNPKLFDPIVTYHSSDGQISNIKKTSPRRCTTCCKRFVLTDWPFDCRATNQETGKIAKPTLLQIDPISIILPKPKIQKPSSKTPQKSPPPSQENTPQKSTKSFPTIHSSQKSPISKQSSKPSSPQPSPSSTHKNETPLPTKSSYVPGFEGLDQKLDDYIRDVQVKRDNEKLKVSDDDDDFHEVTPPKPAGKGRKRKLVQTASPAPCTTYKKSLIKIKVKPIQPQNFNSRALVKGRNINVDKMRYWGAGHLVNCVKAQGWEELFSPGKSLAQDAVYEFYNNAEVLDELKIKSTVNGICFILTPAIIADCLKIPNEGFKNYVKGIWPETNLNQLAICEKFAGKKLASERLVNKAEMSSDYRLLLVFITKNILPRKTKHFQTSYMDLVLLELLDTLSSISLPTLMLHHLNHIITHKRNHTLGYGFILTKIIQNFMSEPLPVRNDKESDEFDEKQMTSYGYLIKEEKGKKSMKRSVPPPTLGIVQRQQIDFQQEVADLRRDLNAELTSLKDHLDAKFDEVYAMLKGKGHDGL